MSRVLNAPSSFVNVACRSFCLMPMTLVVLGASLLNPSAFFNDTFVISTGEVGTVFVNSSSFLLNEAAAKRRKKNRKKKRRKKKNNAVTFDDEVAETEELAEDRESDGGAYKSKNTDETGNNSPASDSPWGNSAGSYDSSFKGGFGSSSGDIYGSSTSKKDKAADSIISSRRSQKGFILTKRGRNKVGTHLDFMGSYHPQQNPNAWAGGILLLGLPIFPQGLAPLRDSLWFETGLIGLQVQSDAKTLWAGAFLGARWEFHFFSWLSPYATARAGYIVATKDISNSGRVIAPFSLGVRVPLFKHFQLRVETALFSTASAGFSWVF